MTALAWFDSTVPSAFTWVKSRELLEPHFLFPRFAIPSFIQTLACLCTPSNYLQIQLHPLILSPGRFLELADGLPHAGSIMTHSTEKLDSWQILKKNHVPINSV